MKRISLLITLAALITSCEKVQDTMLPLEQSAEEIVYAKSGGGSSGGGSTSTGLIQSVLSGSAARLIGGNSDSIWVSFSQPAPVGLSLNLTSSDPSVLQAPAAYPVTPGAFAVHPPVTSNIVTASKLVTIRVALGSQTKTTTLKVFPLHYNFPAPQLQSPGNGAGFKSRIQVKFTWSDNANAYYHNIQISDNPAFSNTPILENYLNDPIWAASYFNGLGKRYWRVRYIDASGAPGPWSPVNMFEIKS